LFGNLVNKGLPLVNIQKAIENGHWNSWFSHEKWWFSIVMLVFLPEGNCWGILEQTWGRSVKCRDCFDEFWWN
jgi:hypothetical protein